MNHQFTINNLRNSHVMIINPVNHQCSLHDLPMNQPALGIKNPGILVNEPFTIFHGELTMKKTHHLRMESHHLSMVSPPCDLGKSLVQNPFPADHRVAQFPMATTGAWATDDPPRRRAWTQSDRFRAPELWPGPGNHGSTSERPSWVTLLDLSCLVHSWLLLMLPG